MLRFLANQVGSEKKKMGQNKQDSHIIMQSRKIKFRHDFIFIFHYGSKKPSRYRNRVQNVGNTLNRPKFGFNLPAKTLRAVDFPIPFVPTKPRTCPGLGTGSLQ